MQSGYKTITPIQLANALSVLQRGELPPDGLRVYLACFAMVAIREAAARHASKQRHPSQTIPRFKCNELERLTRLGGPRIRRALQTLQRNKLIQFTENRIEITERPLPGSEELLAELSCGRSPLRPIPVPRSMLRFLAQNRKSSLTLTAMGYLVRGVSLSRRGKISGRGTAKASWIADTLGLSERAVRYARLELIRLGWFERDTGSFQRKLNRDGAYFSINLDWSFTLKNHRPVSAAMAPVANLPEPFVNPDKDVREFAPLPSENTPVFAPPYKDRKTSIESKNQKAQGAEAPCSGVCLKEMGEASAAKVDLPAASLHHLRREDFFRLSRLEALYAQAVERGWIRASESMALNFIAAAVRAREVGEDPARMFVALIRRQLWHHITQAQEDHARRALNRYREDHPNRFRIQSFERHSSQLAA